MAAEKTSDMGSLRTVHFMTFGAGAGWTKAARRLGHQARAAGVFESVSVESGKHIFNRFPDFAEHKTFIDGNKRGWGYWIWKPFLIKTFLSRLKDGEVLFYLDAGSEILPENKARYAELFGYLGDIDAAFLDYAGYPIFNLPFWTKQSLLERFKTEFGMADPLHVPKLWAGVVAFVKNEKTVRLVDDWFRLCTTDNYHLVDDTPSPMPHPYGMFQHRYDQSVLSGLKAVYGFPTYSNAMDVEYDKIGIDVLPLALSQPFLAMRNPTEHSMVDYYRKNPLPPGMTKSTRTLAEQLTTQHRDVLQKLGLL